MPGGLLTLWQSWRVHWWGYDCHRYILPTFLCFSHPCLPSACLSLVQVIYQLSPTCLPSLQSECYGSTTLSTPVQLPCTELHVASWENRSVCWHIVESKILKTMLFLLAYYWFNENELIFKNTIVLITSSKTYFCMYLLPQDQEKRGDIIASLKLLVESVKVFKAQSQPGCAASLLQRLENNINNYLLILTQLQLSVGGSHSDKLHTIKITSNDLVICWRLLDMWRLKLLLI